MIPALATPAAVGLPPLNSVPLPREVREGGPDAKEAYRAALGFERLLVGELTKTMARSAMPAGEDREAAGSPYRDLLSDTLAESMSGSGGIGLADELFRALRVGGAR